MGERIGEGQEDSEGFAQAVPDTLPEVGKGV